MRILNVAYPDSVHIARWVKQFAGLNWDIHLFPVHDGPVHQGLRDVTVHSFYSSYPASNNPHVRRKGMPWPVLSGRGKIKTLVGKLAPHAALDGARLARTIQQLKPDIIHVHEMQRAGYLTLEGRTFLNGTPLPPCIYSSWGSDFYRYGSDPEHERRIRAFMDFCDYFISDCQRDVRLAREYGFKGEDLGVIPVGGGFDLEGMRKLRQPGPVSDRRAIILKGYHSDRLLGRALVVLKALSMCRDLLEGYEIITYSADEPVVEKVLELERTTGLRFNILPHSPHQEVVKLMGRSRIAISSGLTDGTPNAMLEAMIMGAFPVQSDTVSTAEWIDDGRNGFLIPPENPAAIAEALRKALTDDQLVNRAAELNEHLTAERCDYNTIQPQVIAMYEKVLKQGSVRGKVAAK
jgi:glycosyltransferase involved in cell wall biosynthesis